MKQYRVRTGNLKIKCRRRHKRTDESRRTATADWQRYSKTSVVPEMTI